MTLFSPELATVENRSVQHPEKTLNNKKYK
jgi:hypothetical protein